MKIVLSILVFVLLLLVAAAWVIYRFAFYVSPRKREDPYVLPDGPQYQTQRPRMLSLIRDMDQLPYEPVTIQSFDGTVLTGRYYVFHDGAPLQIQFHGYHGTPLRDFCGGCRLARELGHNVLAIDQRAHGGSGGVTITFGIRERQDCLAWANYARQRFGEATPIFLSGVSMGAATVLMASELALPSNVAGIIADCPYSAPEAILRKVCRTDMQLPPALVMPLLHLGARLFGGFDPREASAVQAVQHTTLPVLLLHGEDDRFVPCAMSREIYDACAGYRILKTFPGAGHGLSYIVDTATYGQTVSQFTDDCLQRLTASASSSLPL